MTSRSVDQSVSQTSQSVDRSVAVSSSFRAGERSLDRGQLLISLSPSLSVAGDKFTHGATGSLIDVHTVAARAAAAAASAPAPNWRQLRRRRTLRAVARLGGYFLIDIEMIYVCCLMSSHTQTQADRRTDRRTERRSDTDSGTDRQFSFHATLVAVAFLGSVFTSSSAATCGYQSLT